MGRDFVINGETLVLVKGHNALAGPSDLDGRRRPYLHELGLAEGQITVSPRFIQQDIKCDDFGPSIPAEIMFQLADVTVSMSLIHFDQDVLEYCLSEALCRPVDSNDNINLTSWTLPGAGALMGNGLSLTKRGNYFVSLNLTSPKLGRPWRFPASFLTSSVTLPLGTRRTVAQLQWRAIPYTILQGVVVPSDSMLDDNNVAGFPGEIRSRGTLLWDRTLDT